MSVIKQLDSPNLKLSKSDRRLLDYIKKNGLNACSAPISEIAKACNVSHATVTRFARKFGYASLRNFKIDLAREFGSDEVQSGIIAEEIEYNEPCETTVKKLLQLNLANLRSTSGNIDPRMIKGLADKIDKDHRLFFIGIGNSGFAAADSAYKFMRTGIDARCLSDPHLILIESTFIRETDIVIAISNSGQTAEIVQGCKNAKSNGAYIAAITANPVSQLSSLASCSLVYSAHETMMETGSLHSKIAVFFIVDLIYTEVVKRMGPQASVNKQKTALAVQKTESPIL